MTQQIRIGGSAWNWNEKKGDKSRKKARKSAKSARERILLRHFRSLRTAVTNAVPLAEKDCVFVLVVAYKPRNEKWHAFMT